jgi:hypothetical protein
VESFSFAKLWHKRFEHLNNHSIQFLGKQQFGHGVPLLPESKSICPSYMEGKLQSRHHIVKIVERYATSLLALVHTNLCGMIHLAPLGGAPYFISFIDDFSCFTWLHFLKQKSETLQTFKKMCAKVEVQFIPLKLLALCSGRGRKYVLGDFFTFCTKIGITHELTQAYTPSHNGVSEQKNHTFFKKAHLMVVDAQTLRFLLG